MSTTLQTVTSIDDLRDIAKARVPKAFFEYADHGSYSQSTMRANRSDLQAIGLRQRVAIDVDKRDLQTTIAGIPAKLPLALAPIGLCGMQHGDGEILAARAAAAAVIPFCLSTMSICGVPCAVLVSALCHARQRLRQGAHRACYRS